MEFFKGSLLYYRVYDIGNEVDLVVAADELSKVNEAKKFRLRRSSRAMMIEEAPVVVTMGGWKQEIFSESYNVSAIGKVWSFGAISICLKFDFQDTISYEKLKDISIHLEEDPLVHNLSIELTTKLISDIGAAVKKANTPWEQYEDYIIFQAEPGILSTSEIQQLAQNDKLYELILLDRESPLSEQTKAGIRSHIFQYGQNDVAVLDWNSAFILSEGDAQDIADVIEFSLCQLLELRYYDDLLDKKLNILYKSIQQSEPGIFTTKYSKLSKDAALIYIEISEVIEKIENSLKVIGDFYFAKIYRASLDRFRFLDWKQSVDQKLKSLAELSVLFQGQVNEKKNQLMELIIILLIAIEVIPFLWKVLKPFIT